MKTKALRQALAKIAANPTELLKYAPGACRAAVPAGELVLREAGVNVTTARHDELLAKCAAGEYVELEVDLLAYEQQAGNRNRNSVRFRDGAMTSLGRSGKGSPFLRDHAQYDTLAKAGTVTASSTEKLADGSYQVRQTVKLTALWAVDMALRGLLDTVSIGWRPTGPVNCSACNAPIFTRCYHFPGDRLVEKDDAEGKRVVRAADGPIVVEWIYTAAELIETSVVNVPGVPNARIDDVRASMHAALSAANPSLQLGAFDEVASEIDLNDEEKDNAMKMKLLALLGLAVTASDDEIIAAANARVAAAGADKAELALAQKELEVYKTDLDKLNADKRQKAEDAFITGALSTGRIAKVDEGTWREFYQLSADRAEKRMGERQPGTSTPVGQPRQSGGGDPDKVPVIAGGEPVAPQLDARQAQFARVFGYVDQSGALSAMPTTLGATTIVNNGDLEAARVGFHASFRQALEQKTDDPLQEIYTTIASARASEEHHFFGDLPGFEEWTNDRKLGGLEAFKIRLANKDWSNGLRVKQNDFKDDNLGLLPPQVAALGLKARRHRWDLMIKLLLNGFDGTAYPDLGDGLSYDDAFFFSDSHASGDNKATAALDAAGLTAVELLLESQTTFDGIDPLDVHGTHLIVGPKLRATAEKLLEQERLASGESNYHRGKYKLIVSQRIRGTYDDYWFLADLSAPIKPCLFQMREEISTSAIMGGQGSQQDSIPRFQKGELWFGAEARYNVGYFEHRTIVGSAV